jgi:RNA polymerase sigma-70 factor (ECF subfamily)
VAEQGDDALIERVAAGDSAALAALYDRYGRLAYGLAYRVLADASAAEEAVQDAFVQVWRHAATFDPARGAGFRAWLMTIVHRRSIDLVRSRTPQRARETELEIDSPLQGEPDPLVQVLDTLYREQIRRAMTTLPDDQRRAIEQAYFEGLTHHEIAERNGLPLGTVKGRLRLGLQKLHGALSATGHRVATGEHSGSGYV